MAKHSKYDNIKHRKAAQDAKRGKIFSLHAKQITLAAQKEGDPEKNANLAMLIEKAKKAGVPSDNIERSIKKGTGEYKDELQILEIVYEGYSPGGVAMLVNVLTDNKNRTASIIKHIFSKYGGNLGEPGSVSWMFKRKGIIMIDSNKYTYDKIEEMVYETEAEDIFLEDDIIKIITQVKDFNDIIKFFNGKNIKIEEYKISYIPENKVKIIDFDKTLKFVKMKQAFNECEDVESISSNEEISKDLLKEVNDFIEKNTFRT